MGSMSASEQYFERAYALVQQRLEAGGKEGVLPSRRVVLYQNTCVPGILDVQELMDADRTEFLQMAYYSLLGTLPEPEVLQSWQEKTELSEWEYRKAVLETLMQNPEVAFKGRSIRNNIYAYGDEDRKATRKGLKRGLLATGYRMGRSLPLWIKVPLKKLVMKLITRG